MAMRAVEKVMDFGAKCCPTKLSAADDVIMGLLLRPRTFRDESVSRFVLIKRVTFELFVDEKFLARAEKICSWL